MSKNKIIVLASLMGIALVGIISIQVYWVLHDWELKKQKFSQQVLESMSSAVKKLENQESLDVILSRSGVLGDSASSFFRSPVPPVPPQPVIPGPPGVNAYDSISSIIDSIDFPEVVFNDDEKEQEVKIIRSKDRNQRKFSITVRASHIDSLMNEQAILNEKIAKLNEQLVESHGDVKQKIMLKMENLTNVLQQMAYEFDFRQTDVMKRVNPNLIDSLVGLELKDRGIGLPYAISILDGRKNTVPWKHSEIANEKGDVIKFKVNLFPGDIVPRKDLLQLEFANTFSYFLSSIWLMLVCSAIFTIVIISGFTFTIVTIVRQKRLADIKNDFINNMTHEFKTPIASIRLAMDAIQNPSVIHDAEKIRYYSNIVRDENDRMYNHVENILQIAQFDRNEFKPQLTDVNIHEVMQDSISKMEIQVASKGGTIDFTPSATDPVVKADARFVPVVIFNLLDNAIKYGGDQPKIKTGTMDVENGIIIFVEDNGIGMSKEIQNKIFDKFYRVTSGNIHNVKGFGLGLSYVKAIALAHHGNVKVISSPGNGSRFEVFIPRNPKL